MNIHASINNGIANPVSPVGAQSPPNPQLHVKTHPKSPYPLQNATFSPSTSTTPVSKKLAKAPLKDETQTETKKKKYERRKKEAYVKLKRLLRCEGKTAEYVHSEGEI